MSQTHVEGRRGHRPQPDRVEPLADAEVTDLVQRARARPRRPRWRGTAGGSRSSGDAVRSRAAAARSRPAALLEQREPGAGADVAAERHAYAVRRGGGRAGTARCRARRCSSGSARPTRRLRASRRARHRWGARCARARCAARPGRAGRSCRDSWSPAEQLPHGVDLGGVLVDVRCEPTARRSSRASATHEASSSSVHDSEKRGMTAYRGAADARASVPRAPGPRRTRARAWCAGRRAAAGRSTTRPLVIRSPPSAAASNRRPTPRRNATRTPARSWCPASTSAADELARDRAGVVDVGEPRLLGQRALVEPVEQRHAEAADRPHLREVHVRVDEARAAADLRAGRRPFRRDAEPAVGEGPSVDDHPIDDDASPRVVIGTQRASGERVVGRVENLGAVQSVIGRARLAPTIARWRSKAQQQVAATLTAIVAGSLPVISVSPIGVVIRAMVCGVVAVLGKPVAEPRPLARPSRSVRSSRTRRHAAPRRTAPGPRHGRGS